MTAVPKDSKALPLFLQLSELLIRDIAAGRLADGDKLPTEREMALEHGTTVTTLRKALAVLAEKGLLQRVHGSGNYVRHTPLIDSVYAMFRLELHNGGGLPKAQVLDVARMVKPDDLPKFGTSARATRIRRLRFMDKTKIAIEEIWLDRDAGAVTRALLQDSLYRFYKIHLGFWISRAEDRVGIAPLPDWTPTAYPHAPGKMSGYIERFSWAQTAAPVEFSRTWFDADQAHYVQRLH